MEPEHDPLAGEPQSPSFRLQELKDAQKACEHWKLAILLSLLCGIVGLVFECLACHKLYKARATLRNPSLALVLAVVWPGLDIANMVLSMVVLPFGLDGWISVARIMVIFFVTQSIFLQWRAIQPDEDLKALIARWERYTMFGQFPLAAIIAWVLVAASVEGWTVSDFDLDMLRTEEWIVAGIIVLALGILGICSIYYEYQTLKYFQTRVWARLAARRERILKERKEARRLQEAAATGAEDAGEADEFPEDAAEEAPGATAG